ncbi:MAG TPA: phosphate ABC transporter substrate-binding protein PstS [Gaiellaceae bacterium]|nr:phosphate ABC transporter substrate-binding protein PstS [Gaiellaceae bacterium]
MRSRFALVGVALLAAVAATATAANAGRAAKAGDQLVGAGSTFVAPLISQWQKDYPPKTGVNIVYSPIGSGGGIQAITSKTVDFGASDAPLTPDQFAACGDCVQIPWALGATAIIYNLSGIPNNLHITGPVLAQIFLGRIRKWNDPALQSLNPKVKLPNTDITPVYRSDGSGTSYNFTDYLSKVSPAWKSKIGVSTQPSFPVGVGGRGSSGVSGVVSKTDGAIGYADIAYALVNHLKFFFVKNAAGKFAGPGLRGIAAAASTITKKSIPANNEMHIVDPPKTNKVAYPICTFTYVILHTTTPKAAQLRRFVFYALTQGQQFGPRILFQKIPVPVLVAAEKTLNKIHPPR